ncbi:MAG: WbuC family cupin fold metalloprotein [Leptospiraceae bacterium]|nr:WbuC family cupin fold metalloprotein [Leptospiraceae bacterium]MCK6379855.1 WbuC family cupin fold metalloprotein [Leptospiraceae bacterium]NUM42510.1 WbuC family cupin fold metalloprotein [Leptospiraceae bacterium]
MQNKKIISLDLFQETIEKAKTSKRKRANYNFHDLSEVYQRFLNVLIRGTYIRPHKHSKPPKPETFISLKGNFGFFLFDDSGKITEKYLVSSEGPIYGIDVSPNVWHSAICLSDYCVCFEGKSGPYNPSEDKLFASWAPEEESEGVQKYLEYLESLFGCL